jgi:cyclophilin family peptidyl-prolyl cis-trans isomerase
MAKHRSATEVTVAPLAERSLLETWVDQYWKIGLAIFLVIAGGILFRQYRTEQAQEVQDQGWAKLTGLIDVVETQFGAPQVTIGDPAALERFAAENASIGAGAWAQLMAVSGHADQSEFGAALAALDEFTAEHPDHPLATQTLDFDGEQRTLTAELRQRIASLAALHEELPGLQGNPEPPPGSPQVRIDTSEGPIEITLYEDRAPQHVANFLKLAREGTYAGTKFHRTMPGFMIQGGDQNSIGGAPETWGSGDAGYTIPQEFSDLQHFPGVLAMAKRPDQEESSGHQFYITVGSPMHLDGVHTVFGKVTSGMDIVRRIATRPTVQNTDRPIEPITIDAVEVL